MKAVVIERHGGPEVLRYQDAPDPRPEPGQVLIQNRLTSVNFADIHTRSGGYRGKEPPLVPGLDLVGTVEEVGEGASGLEPGRRVAAFAAAGSYAEKVLADARLCYPLPDGVNDEDAAGLAVLVTAYNAMTLAGRLQPGETVLVKAAAGGVGSCAVQLAKALGAGKVIALAGGEEKLELAKSLGADVGIDYLKEKEGVAARVLAATEDRGVDLVLESIGGESLEESFGYLAPFGRLVVFGHTSGEAANISSKLLHQTNRAVIGYSSGGYRQHRPQALRPAVEAAFDLVGAGKAKVVIGARFGLKDAAAAHALVESRKSVGKVLLEP